MEKMMECEFIAQLLEVYRSKADDQRIQKNMGYSKIALKGDMVNTEQSTSS